MREYIDIVEDAVSDIDQSSLAHKAWVETYSYVYDDKPLKDINIGDRDGLCLFMRDLDVDPVFYYTCLVFLPPNPAQPHNMGASTHKVKPAAHGCDTFVLFRVETLDKEGILRFLSPSQFIFTHELIHVMDGSRHKSPDTMPYGDPNDPTAYYNDPVELNAYFHNIAEPLLSRLTFIKSDGPEVLDLFDPIPRDFREFFAKQAKSIRHEPLKKFLAHLTEKNRRRLISRLRALHTEFWNTVDAQSN